MTPQLVLFILGILAFVAAVGLAVAAFLVYRRDDIRAVRDDLSGKTRQQNIEQAKKTIVRDRRSRRGSDTPSATSSSAPAGATVAKADGRVGTQGQGAGKLSAQKGSKRKKRKGEQSVPAPAQQEARKSKSIEDYQAEYTQPELGHTWDFGSGDSQVAEGSADAGVAISGQNASEQAASPAEPAGNPIDASGLLEDYLESEVEKVSFRIVRTEMVVNWQEDSNE